MKLAKEVVMNFGPDYYRDYKEPEISKKQVFEDDSEGIPEVMRNAGRPYYTVTLFYDREKEQLAEKFAAAIDIWADDGEPMRVLFGNGMGINFFFNPYREWTKAGVKDSEKMHFQTFSF
ncbi:MAG: hypothetical protein IJ693_05015 [Bacteroidaceae bacterium]|nr:hypothetical protein [Bacteroidaceae bacterium]